MKDKVMKDKVMMMYDHIRSSVDVDPWAIEELRRVLDAYLADGCYKCAFADYEEWNMPCLMCNKNCKNFSITWSDKTARKTKLYCRKSGYLCEFATEHGYCQITMCVKEPLAGRRTDGNGRKEGTG